MYNIAVLIWENAEVLDFCGPYEAFRNAEEVDDIYPKAWAYMFHGFSCYVKGYPEEAIDCLLKGLDFAERLNFPSLTNLIASSSTLV